MILAELKQFINSIPSDMDEFSVVNGEFGLLDPEDDNSVIYRVDKPILIITVDEQSREVVFLHQTREDVNSFTDDGNP